MTIATDIWRRSQAAEEWRRGWTVVLASGFGIGLAAFPTYTLGLFIQPLSKNFGWTISAIVVAQTIASLASAFSAPFAGAAMDRFGARPVVLTGGVALCILFGLLAFNGGSIWTFYGLWLFLGVSTAITSPMIWLKAPLDRFEVHRGLASSIALCGSSLAGAIGPLLAALLLAKAGWQAAYLGLAAYMLVSAIPLAYIFYFDERALKARSGATLRDLATNGETVQRSGLAVSEAVRTREFWALLTSFFFAGAGIVTFLVHIVPLLVSKNFTTLSAASAMTAFSIASLCGRLLTGWLMDRTFAPWLAAGALLLPALGAQLLLGDASYFAVIFVAVLGGLAAGAIYTLLSNLTVIFFGLRRYGTISAYLNTSFTLGCTAGPLVAAWRVTATGDYGQAVILIGGCFFLGAILMPICRRNRLLDRQHLTSSNAV